MIYYNTRLDILGLLQENKLLLIEEETMFMVYSLEWEYVGDL